MLESLLISTITHNEIDFGRSRNFLQPWKIRPHWLWTIQIY